jgi:glutathione S-transferase
MFRERMRAMTPEQRAARFDNPDRKRGDQFREAYEHGTKARHVVYGVSAYDRAFGQLEAALADKRGWIMGAAPTLDDISLMPFAARLDYLGRLDLWTDERPHVKAW